MKLPIIALSVFALMSSADVMAWGKTGHRVTGKIAENYLSDAAKANIKAL